MLQYKESFIDYVWQNGLFDLKDLQTTAGEKLEIISFGKKNRSDGPDYFAGKVRLGETIWVGNIELHVSSSDWLLHRHQLDPAYHNVVLHVVLKDDKVILNHVGQAIPTLQLQSRIPRYIYDHYEHLQAAEQWVPCANMLKGVSELTRIQCLDRMCIERLESKVRKIQNILAANKNDWELSAVTLLAQAFGSPLNGQAFERIINSVADRALKSLRSKETSLHALLLGQSAMLEPHKGKDPYVSTLHAEYLFLANKYRLRSLREKSCKFFGLRPSGFPSIRLAQLTAVLHGVPQLFSEMMEIKSQHQAADLFRQKLPEYWDCHYSFKKAHSPRQKQLTDNFIRHLLINAVCPLQFCWASLHKDEQKKAEAIELLQSLPAENNKIISKWEELGITSNNAADSQALLYLKREYCDQKKCLECQIGHVLISRKNT